MMIPEKHNARGQAGIVGEAVTSRGTSQDQNTTPGTADQPRNCAAFIKIGLVWMGSHGFLPVFVACWLIQTLRLMEV